jgi:hypothetical protein
MTPAGVAPSSLLNKEKSLLGTFAYGGDPLASRAIIIAPHHRWLEAGLIESFHGAVDVDLADADVMDVIAMGTIEFQRQLPILAETLHVHLDAGGRLSARIRTGKEEACHGDLLRALKK